MGLKKCLVPHFTAGFGFGPDHLLFLVLVTTFTYELIMPPKDNSSGKS